MAAKYYGLMAATGTFGGLSTWQLNRYFWKKDLLDARREAMEAEPIRDLPDKPPTDIQRVEVTGSFYDDDYVIVELGAPNRSTLGRIEEKDACMLFVPCITRDNKHVMVNKGQIPASLARDPEAVRELLQRWPANTSVQGVFRKHKKRTVNDCRYDRKRYRHPYPELMWTDWYDKYNIKETARHPLPYWVDVTDQPFPAEDSLPLTKARQEYATHIISPTVHLVYFTTWTCAFGFCLWAFHRHGPRLFAQGMKSHDILMGGTDGMGNRA
eukprot:Hpha_TRINITY_DN18048_c0_g1::TRINITY_DN18048_c0_g1_i1::g.1160::m.1160/K14998/SURF1, SHY1; surfeit locus 1 family protein